MGSTHRIGYPIIASMRDHVLTPCTAAKRTVEAERGEIEAERQAFVEFRERVAGIEPVSTPDTESIPLTSISVMDRHSRGTERARAIFRETVMSVNHYDETYDETLKEHATAEFSANVAAVLHRETATPFTEWHKTTLTSAADSVVVQKEQFRELLEEESRSLDRNRTVLAGIIDSFNDPDIHSWYQEGFEDRLDEISRVRQERIQQRDTSPRTDGHDLCQYLYQDHEWTYPVLTGVTRLQDAIV